MPQSWALKRNDYSKILCSAFSQWSHHAWYFQCWFIYAEDYWIQVGLIGKNKRNSEDWGSDDGKESGITPKFDCVKSFMDTDVFHKFSTKYGLDSKIVSSFCESFATHVDLPKDKCLNIILPLK